MYVPWRNVFPDGHDLQTPESREWELTTFPANSPASRPTTVEQVDGAHTLRVCPPRFGPGVWVAGVIIGIASVGIGITISIAPAGGEASVGSVISGVAMVLMGVGFALVTLTHERYWLFDRDGVHRVTGLGRRSTSWADIARLRLVVLRHGGRAASRRQVRLHFLDAAGRSVTDLPHVSKSMNPRRWSAEMEGDVEVLRWIAGECHRSGWLTGVADHRRAGNEENITALMEAAAGDVDEVDRLVASGADLETRDSEGLTALHWAAAWGGPEAVRRLVAAGAEVDARTPYGFTPLTLAESRDRPTVAALRAAGATGELAPLGPVRFATSHWRPVIATLVPTVLAVLAWLVFMGRQATRVDWAFIVAAGIIAALVVLRLSRPLLFWSGGVPTHQVGSRLTLRTPWGRRRYVDLDRVTAAVRAPPLGYRTGRIHGSAVLLVVEDGGWRLTAQRLVALRLGHCRERLLAAGTRGVLVVLDPRSESTVAATMLPRLMAGPANVDSGLHDLLT